MQAFYISDVSELTEKEIVEILSLFLESHQGLVFLRDGSLSEDIIRGRIIYHGYFVVFPNEQHDAFEYYCWYTVKSKQELLETVEASWDFYCLVLNDINDIHSYKYAINISENNELNSFIMSIFTDDRTDFKNELQDKIKLYIKNKAKFIEDL